MKHNSYWEAYLRNDITWQQPYIECVGKTAKEAIELMYAWCAHKKYLKQETEK